MRRKRWSPALSSFDATLKGEAALLTRVVAEPRHLPMPMKWRFTSPRPQRLIQEIRHIGAEGDTHTSLESLWWAYTSRISVYRRLGQRSRSNLTSYQWALKSSVVMIWGFAYFTRWHFADDLSRHQHDMKAVISLEARWMIQHIHDEIFQCSPGIFRYLIFSYLNSNANKWIPRLFGTYYRSSFIFVDKMKLVYQHLSQR